MSTGPLTPGVQPPSQTVQRVEDNPAKPWKAVAAFAAPAVLAFLQFLLRQAAHVHMPVWLWLVIGGLAAAAGTFIVKNPKRLRRPT